MLLRRNLLAMFLAAPAWPLLAARRSNAQDAPRLQPTPACGDDVEPTPENAEGPFYRAGAPDRRQLVEPGLAGERITIAGIVQDTACRPVRGALVEVWHTDAEGDYDNVGQRFRGVQRSDARGRWWFSTIVPALYPGRTRHYHFRIRTRGRAVLTTQLFFPGDPGNARDGLFDDRLVLRLTRTADGPFGRYDFVI